MKIQLIRGDYRGFDYAQTILINNQDVGVMGRLSQDWIQTMGLDVDESFGFEINLEPIFKMLGTKKRLQFINSFPKVPRDLNLVMPETQNVGPVLDMMFKNGKNLIVEAEPVNIFVDKSTLGEGLKSVTFSLLFQHNSKTLEDKDVTPVINDIIHIAESNFNAKLRS